MKGVMFTPKGVTEIIDEPEPTCREDEVLLKMLYSGISNGTEISFLTGGPYGGQKWPNRIAYLNVSEVIETGTQITQFQKGDVVYTGTYPGHVAYHTAKESDLIIKLPSELDHKSATMLGIAGVSYFNAKRVNITQEDNVLVTGSGGIGLMALQSAKSMGASVTLASRTAHRREQGITMGAHAAFDPDQEADALRDNGPYTVLLECAGAELDSLIDPQKKFFAPFSRAALIAGRFRIDYTFGWASRVRLSFYQSSYFDQSTLETVTSRAAKGVLNLNALIQDIVPIDHVVEIYNTLRDDPLSLGGTVFDWSN